MVVILRFFVGNRRKKSSDLTNLKETMNPMTSLHRARLLSSSCLLCLSDAITRKRRWSMKNGMAEFQMQLVDTRSRRVSSVIMPINWPV